MRHISCSFSRASGQGSFNSVTSEAEVPAPAPRCGDAKASSVFLGLPVAGDEEVKDSLTQHLSIQFSSVQSLSRVRLFATP